MYRCDLRKNLQGFSLLELMVTLVIIGMLAAIAVPQYNQYIAQSTLSNEITKLSATRIAMEQFKQAQRRYNDNPNSVTCGVNVADFDTDAFAFTCTTPNDGNSFTVTATSKAGAGLGAAGSYVYTIDQLGNTNTTAYPGFTTGTLPCLAWRKPHC
ncbi:MAG: prepilin-type N-terminal cleavage/methylation domain-containing protein [Gammaproteobacteria bacterium]|nr:prepilin-type N-terminal cleavage/methylation domain-containing protein [Gammaproteobacteria bacterium]MDH5803099.1 prepilin-type N-terminal cleavage/methylation domain-containing protein [Gammaproteobacteria bacterium]